MTNTAISKFVPISQRVGRKNPRPTWFRPWLELDPHDPGNFHHVRCTQLSAVLYAAARLRRYRMGQLSFFGNRIMVKKKRKSLTAIPFWGEVVYKSRKGKVRG